MVSGKLHALARADSTDMQFGFCLGRTSLWRPDAGSGELGRAVEVAVRTGYRLLDTAWIYKNEDEIGIALRGLFEEGVVTREEMFITSKLW